MRRFELIEGSSSKFWEVEVVGSTMKVTFGRIGTSGSAKEKQFESEGDAEREAAKLVAEKTRNGYVETGPSGAKASSRR